MAGGDTQHTSMNKLRHHATLPNQTTFKLFIKRKMMKSNFKHIIQLNSCHMGRKQSLMVFG